MKKIIYFLCAAAALASCSSSYNIQGTSDVQNLDGHMLYIKALQQGNEQFRHAEILLLIFIASFYQIISDPDRSLNICECKFHAAAFSGAIHLCNSTMDSLPIGIGNLASVANFHQSDGTHYAILLIKRLGKIKIVALKFGVFKPADHTVHTKVWMNGFFRIEENISRQPMMTLLQAFSFDPFALDNNGRNTSNAIRILDDVSNNITFLRFAKQAVGVHVIAPSIIKMA